MEAGMIDVEKYLNRIQLEGNVSATLDVLKTLQKQHLVRVPFENLDIHAGEQIHLNIDRIYKKIVLEGRGGFCYELNGLFYELLHTLGFRVKRVSARVFDEINGYGQEYDHLAIIATIDEKDYLTDVGFGEFAFGPLLLAERQIQHDERGDFIVEDHGEGYLRVSQIIDGNSRPEYIFKTLSRDFSEFETMCVYHQTDPRSHFTKKKMITRPVEQGRITLAEDTLKIKDHASLTETPVTSPEEFNNLLNKYFGIQAHKLKGLNQG